MTHPFEEYHSNAAIGNLMCRIDRRGDQIFFSQDGGEIHELLRAQKSDRDKLRELMKAEHKEQTNDI